VAHRGPSSTFTVGQTTGAINRYARPHIRCSLEEAALLFLCHNDKDFAHHDEYEKTG
jgi:hypothetical protein